MRKILFHITNEYKIYIRSKIHMYAEPQTLTIKLRKIMSVLTSRDVNIYAVI